MVSNSFVLSKVTSHAGKHVTKKSSRPASVQLLKFEDLPCHLIYTMTKISGVTRSRVTTKKQF